MLKKWNNIWFPKFDQIVYLGCEDGWTNFTNKCYKKFEPSTEFYWIDAHENCQKNGVRNILHMLN